MSKLKLAILASGAGSTAEPLFDKASLIITNNPNAGIIQRAQQYGVDCIVLDRRDYYVYKENGEVDQTATRLKYGLSLLTTFKIYEIEHISQNGWSIKTPANVIQAFSGKIVNSHPAPLDPGYLDFGGLGMHGLAVHAAVLNFKRMINRPFNHTEVVLHEVIEEYDKGKVFAATLIPIQDGDTPETLQNRVKEYEKQQNKAFWDKIEAGSQLVPLMRTSRLILPGEEQILEEAKRQAIAQYPKG